MVQEIPFSTKEINQSYLTFISIVFGVFISVWVSPITTLLHLESDQLEQPDLIYFFHDPQSSAPAFGKNPQDVTTEAYTDQITRLKHKRMTHVGVSLPQKPTAIKESFDTLKQLNNILGHYLKRLWNVKTLQGLLMFWIMICLWWWYGIFLGRVRPARGLILYGYDFITLGTFALAFRFWDHNVIYPVSVLLAGAMVWGRFIWSLKYATMRAEKNALWWGIATLSCMPLMLFAVPMVLTSYGFTLSDSIPFAVMGFHVSSILVTVFAAWKLGVFWVVQA